MKVRTAGLVLGLLIVGGCEPFCGGEDPLADLVPEVQLVDPLDESVSPCAEDKTFDCEHAFGEVPTNQGRFYTVRVFNSGDADLEVSELVLEGDPAFTLASAPEPDEDGNIVIPDGKEQADDPLDLTIRFTPQVASEVTATLTIVSDADNVAAAEAEAVELVLIGIGVDVGGPELVVSPEQCAFGEVGVGATAYCDLTLQNVGDRDLLIEDLVFTDGTPLALDGDGQFDPAEPGFGMQTLFFEGTFVAPGTATSVRLFATPGAPSDISGALEVLSNDPGRPVVEVPLTVQGAEAPTAVAEVLSVNGELVGESLPPIRPLDDVILTGENSVASTVDEEIEAYSWEIVSGPDGTDADSSVTLTDPNGVTTGFKFDSSGETFNGIDVAGTYVVRLTVTDTGGLTSTNDARVSFNAIPSEALHLQLTWDSPDYDFDLHVLKEGGAYCGPDSCYYGNCKAGDPLAPPEWDGVAGPTAGDPSLDIDDLSGFGPENINIDAPSDGALTVAVHAYSSEISGPVFATLKVFVNGALAWESTRQMLGGRDLWEAAEIDWANGAAILSPLDAYYEEAGSCPGGFDL